MSLAFGVVSLVFFSAQKVESKNSTLWTPNPYDLISEHFIVCQLLSYNSSTVKDNGTPESEATGSQGQS